MFLIPQETAPLGAGGTWTSNPIELGPNTDFNFIHVAVMANQNSADNGVTISGSSNGTTYYPIAQVTFESSGIPLLLSAPCVAKFLKISFVNGTDAQSSFNVFVGMEN